MGTQTLGGRVDAAPIDPYMSIRPHTDAARYLICSDGLTDAVDDTAITAILRNHDGGRAGFELWNASIAAAAPDNITVRPGRDRHPTQGLTGQITRAADV